MCDRAFKSTVIAFLQKDRMNFLAVGRPRVTSPDQPDVSTWFWFGHSNTTGSLTVICSVCYSQETVKLFICWCLETLMCQPAACQQLPSFASGDRQFTVRPIMHYVFPAVAFEANLIRDCCITLDAHWIQVLLLLAMLQWSLRANWFCTLAITLLFSFQRILLFSLYKLLIMVTH